VYAIRAVTPFFSLDYCCYFPFAYLIFLAITLCQGGHLFLTCKQAQSQLLEAWYFPLQLQHEKDLGFQDCGGKTHCYAA
jgi:hypothetical protein